MAAKKKVVAAKKPIFKKNPVKIEVAKKEGFEKWKIKHVAAVNMDQDIHNIDHHLEGGSCVRCHPKASTLKELWEIL